MTHPSPTAPHPLPWRREANETMARFLAADDTGIAIAEKGSANDKLWSFILTHIAALEAEMAADKKIKEAVCSQLEIADFANASLALACVQDELKRLQAEAQLATRLPTRAEIEAKFGEWAMTGESTVMKARWMHEWLLSGAATPAPTAALTEEEREFISRIRGYCWHEQAVSTAEAYRLVHLIERLTKSPPQGAEAHSDKVKP